MNPTIPITPVRSTVPAAAADPSAEGVEEAVGLSEKVRRRGFGISSKFGSERAILDRDAFRGARGGIPSRVCDRVLGGVKSRELEVVRRGDRTDSFIDGILEKSTDLDKPVSATMSISSRWEPNRSFRDPRIMPLDRRRLGVVRGSKSGEFSDILADAIGDISSHKLVSSRRSARDRFGVPGDRPRVLECVFSNCRGTSTKI